MASFFQREGWRIIARNRKFFGVEIDLIILKDVAVIVEVKSLRNWDQIGFRLKKGQARRLLLVRSRLCEIWQAQVSVEVVYVHPKDGCLMVPLEDHSFSGLEY